MSLPSQSKSKEKTVITNPEKGEELRNKSTESILRYMLQSKFGITDYEINNWHYHGVKCDCFKIRIRTGNTQLNDTLSLLSSNVVEEIAHVQVNGVVIIDFEVHYNSLQTEFTRLYDDLLPSFEKILSWNQRIFELDLKEKIIIMYISAGNNELIIREYNSKEEKVCMKDIKDDVSQSLRIHFNGAQWRVKGIGCKCVGGSPILPKDFDSTTISNYLQKMVSPIHQ